MSDVATPAPPKPTSGYELILSLLYSLVERSTHYTQEAERLLHLGAIESLARASGSDVQHITSSLRSKVRSFIEEKGLAVVPPEPEPTPAAPAVTAADVSSIVQQAVAAALAAQAASAPAPGPTPAPVAPVAPAAPAAPVAPPAPVAAAPAESSVPEG